ncbi:TauD/TfdA family dioxygenase [Nonomuraea sp. NPDC049758]|uniref:TauD/TfdA family dioxygenase n=1 Tax=Nonomuraea sp. NPDC049758 TaxID=3154360 RepID=UPI0034316385
MKLQTPYKHDLATNQVAETLAKDGVIFFSEATPEKLTTLLADWTQPYPHPHESSLGLTIIDSDRTESDNAKGFSRAALGLHTDRAQESEQPTIVACLYTSPGNTGGESLILDGKSLIRALERRQLLAYSDNLVLLARRRRWLTIAKQVHGPHSAFRIRYRDDNIAHPYGATAEAARALVAVTQELEFPQIYAFNAGEGYIIHNQRILHGRTSFTGHRVAIRILATISTSSQYCFLNQGFTIDADDANR